MASPHMKPIRMIHQGHCYEIEEKQYWMKKIGYDLTHRMIHGTKVAQKYLKIMISID